MYSPRGDTPLPPVRESTLSDHDPLCLSPLLQSNPSKHSDGAEPGIDLEGGDIPQTEFRSAVADREETIFRHSGWAVRRQRTWEALLGLGVSGMRLDRFRECGAQLYLRVGRTTGDWRICSNACRDRWCLPCQTERARILARALTDRMTDETCRFLTFTLRHSPLPLADQIDRLYACFSALRKRPWITEVLHGGAAFLEIKRGKNSGMWHPHLHVIGVGTYIDQRRLSREWLSVTGDSSIVDVRAIADAAGRASYVTKYVTKPADAAVYESTADLQLMMAVLKGRRLCLTWGSWRGVSLHPEADESEEWESLGSIRVLAQRARGDVEGAYSLWLELQARWPALKRIFDPLSG